MLQKEFRRVGHAQPTCPDSLKEAMMATLKDGLTAKVVEYEHWAKRRRFGRLTPIEFEAIMTTPRFYPIPSGHTTNQPSRAAVTSG